MVLSPKALALTWALLLLTACGKATQPPPPTPLPPTVTASPTPLPPTVTPTPAPPVAVLMAAPQADASLEDAARTWLQALATKEGDLFVMLGVGKPLPPHTVMAVGIGLVPPAAKGARRIVVAPPEGSVAKNIQRVEVTTADLSHQAFLAGYLAVLVTYDWRGGLLASESEKAAATAFENGGRYFCGLCRPLHPPFLAYPQYVLVPPNASAEEWQIALQRLSQAKIKTLVLSPAALAALDAKTLPQDMTAVALGSVPPEMQALFAASIHPDLAAALDTLWEHPETDVTLLPLRVDVFDTNIVTPGKLRLIEEVQQTLQQGLIAPY